MNSDQVKTGCMSSKQINIKTVIAVIFLIVDVLAICGFVYTRTENELHHYGLYIDRPDKLTLNKDITEAFRDETVTVPAGTVIEGGYIVLDTVYFRYLDEWSFSTSYEEFEEQDQLEKLRQEAEQRYNADREKVIKKNIGPGIAAILCGLLICSIITFFSGKDRMVCFAVCYRYSVCFRVIFCVESRVVSLNTEEGLSRLRHDAQPLLSDGNSRLVR